MKLSRARWPHYQKDLPGGPMDFVRDAEYELYFDPERHVVSARHRETGRQFHLDQTGVSMEEFPEPAGSRPGISVEQASEALKKTYEKAPVVPVAPEASGSARTVKSRGR